jgi:hypothetical protein
MDQDSRTSFHDKGLSQPSAAAADWIGWWPPRLGISKGNIHRRGKRFYRYCYVWPGFAAMEVEKQRQGRAP